MNCDAVQRMAESLLCANGLRKVMLRVAAPASAGAQGEELGLATPEFHDLALGAVAQRKAGDETQIVVSAMVVDGIVGALDFDSAKLLFLSAVGVVIAGEVYAVKSCTAMRAEDAVYAYRVMLIAAQV